MPRTATLTCSPKTAVAYARYSSAGQRDVSIEQQLQDIRTYAQREGYTILHEYTDHARSGFKQVERRVEFQRMLSAAKDGKFAVILVWKTDRFARSREDAAVYKGQLRRAGVRVVSAMEPIPEGSAGILLEGMLEATAEWYSRTLSENVTRGMTDNAHRCLWNGTRVIGYCKGPDGRYAINEEEAAVVRRIFERYRSGYSAARISAELNSHGLRTSRGMAFSSDTVLRILGNERYTGTYIWGDIRVPDGIPAIISKKDFEEAQSMRGKTARHIEQGAIDYLLTGKAFCGHCGAAMIGDSGTSRTGARHYYYTCQAHKARKGCDKKSLKKDYLEDLIIDFLLDRVLQDPEIERIAAAVMDAQQKELKNSPLAAMEQELADVNKQIENINNAIAAGVWSSSTVTKLKDLEATAEELKQSADILRYSQSQLVDHDRVIFFLHRIANRDRTDPTVRAYLIRTFVNAAFVFDDHIKLVINNCEGNLQVPLSEMPERSDCDGDGVLYPVHPNHRITIYVIKLAG